MPIPTFTQAEQAQCVEVSGSFPTTNGATTAPSTKRGVGFTVTKPASGTYRVTFDSVYYELISCTVSLQKAALTDEGQAHLGDYTAATGSTGAIQDIYVVDSATPPAAEDPANDDNSRVHFIAKFRRFSGI